MNIHLLWVDVPHLVLLYGNVLPLGGNVYIFKALTLTLLRLRLFSKTYKLVGVGGISLQMLAALWRQFDRL